MTECASNIDYSDQVALFAVESPYMDLSATVVDLFNVVLNYRTSTTIHVVQHAARHMTT